MRSRDSNLLLKGIMTIPPVISSNNNIRETEKARSLYKKLKNTASKIGEGKLSLGMSDDLDIAIQEGSTTIRVGRALFGAREKKL